MPRPGECPAVMTAGTMAVVTPTRAKNWLGMPIWPPPTLALPPRAAKPDANWDVIKSGVFAKGKDYSGPVDELYAQEARLTDIDRFRIKEQAVAEKEYRREQKLREKEMVRIARARKVVADKRKLREEGITRQAMLASYNEFKQAQMEKADDAGAATSKKAANAAKAAAMAAAAVKAGGGGLSAAAAPRRQAVCWTRT